MDVHARRFATAGLTEDLLRIETIAGGISRFLRKLVPHIRNEIPGKHSFI
jgi:hypothetical protein